MPGPDPLGLSAPTLIALVIAFLVLVILVLYFLLAGITNNFGYITSRFGVAKSTLLSLGNGAISEAESVVGQAFDFANQVVSDVDLVAQAYANSFAQVIETVGQALVDVINFIAAYFEASNGALTAEINGFFSGLLVPVFDTIENIITTVITTAGAWFKTFSLSC